MLKRFQYALSHWIDELKMNRQKLSMVGAKTFTEKCVDQHLINWYTQHTDIFFPKVKEIFVDKRDEDIF
jgi:hypothetical protein